MMQKSAVPLRCGPAFSRRRVPILPVFFGKTGALVFYHPEALNKTDLEVILFDKTFSLLPFRKIEISEESCYNFIRQISSRKAQKRREKV